MEQISDSYYVEKVRSGDTDCFAPLLERYSRKVFSLIVKIVGNREDAEELTQDVFMKVFNSLPLFRSDSSFSTWLYRIAYNVAISAARKRKQEFMPVDEMMMESMPDEPDETMFEQTDSNIRAALLNKALERLTAEERAMILLFYKDEKPMKEISIITGLTENNVKTKIFRIRKKLLMLMKQMEEK